MHGHLKIFLLLVSPLQPLNLCCLTMNFPQLPTNYKERHPETTMVWEPWPHWIRIERGYNLVPSQCEAAVYNTPSHTGLVCCCISLQAHSSPNSLSTWKTAARGAPVLYAFWQITLNGKTHIVFNAGKREGYGQTTENWSLDKFRIVCLGCLFNNLILSAGNIFGHGPLLEITSKLKLAHGISASC